MTVDDVDQLAIGLVRVPAGTPRPERTWTRAVLARHARDARLQLVDILELDDDEPGQLREVVTRLGDIAALWRVAVLLTDGLDPELGGGLALDLGLEHQPVSPRQSSTTGS